ncbi:hypothetical protein PFICI_12159 [Pestalotiopsis fici W106-1]|uniref:Uncharacterized protein n=1 Tax=Pestalotiopsis fici (strain W106-1 / CGMCC3.15140) TaxID=1229662 RepID=W3WUI4_PESFW|nr:uncharacterized protein PFICI_12159 [Pestalotiopsis fici W106-1]ETS76772.1 hypothetical protein PFICI_12159 [Pestalotiopsis fici W106-1]
MPVKHDAVESSASRRPLAQKLSGLIIRRGGPGKGGPKSPEIIDEKASIFRFKRQKKAPSPEATPEFKPLEVDLNRLSLSEGWLDTHKDEELEQRQDEHKQQQQQEQQNSSDNTDDSTPIANKYSTMLSLGVQDQGKIDWPYLQKQDSNSNKRPYSMVETSSLAYRRPLQSSSAQSVGSVLDRGRPVEPKRYVTDPLWKTNAILPDPPAQSAPVVEKATTSRHVPRKSIQSIHNDTNALSATTKHNIAAAPQAKAPEKLDRVGRHSMYATPNPTAALPALKPVSTPSSRSSSANPLDRIQQWQKSVTSAPSSNPGAPAANPTSAPSSNAPSRKASTTTTRGVGNRLAWIKELEEKKSGSLGQDIGVLKKASGSVSNRLAMFESKQAAAAPPLSNKKPPLTRTNSTTSRLSSVGLDSTFSANGNTTATPRTSGETVRSSHRASSVMSYYDDSFREKMENVAGSYSDAKDKEKEKESKPEKAGLQRVKTSFVSVDPKKKAESATSDSDVNETEAKEETKSAEPVTAIEQPESKTEDEPQASQSISPVVETAKPEEEIKSAEPAVAEVKTSEEPKAEPQPVEAAAVEKAEEKSESS